MPGGELVPAGAAPVKGELLPPPVPAPHVGEGPGDVLRDFVSRLRPYRPPRPSRELGRAGAIGAALTIAASLLMAALPTPAEVRDSDFYRWLGDGAAASVATVGSLTIPILCLGFACLAVGAALWFKARGTQPVLLFFAAQPCVGVAALALAGVPWLVLIVLGAINVVIWVVVGVLMFIAMVVITFVVIAFIVGMVLGALSDW